MDSQSRLEHIEEIMLVPTGVGLPELEQAMNRLLSRQVDYADLYCQLTRFETWTVEDGIVREGTFSMDQGVGVRAISGEKTGFAYADQLDLKSLTDAVGAARSIAHAGGNGGYRIGAGLPAKPLYPAIDPLPTRRDEDKVALLARLDREARAMDSRVTEVIASLVALYDAVLVVASDGTLAADIRPLVRLNVSVILADGSRREQGYAGAGGRGGLELVMDADASRAIAAEAVRQAVVNLQAIPAPAGNMTVVLGPGWPGVLLHEAIGHGLEGDFNRKQTSAFSGRIGEVVANKQCTVVDDGTLPGRRGSLTVDDEGTPSECTTLIENGVLCGYMQDKHNARLMGTRSTGNARRESYAHTPMPRMTNTYMLPGKYDPAEILASVEKGIYAPNFGGGQVDITSGKFVFSISEGYLIENGKKTQPVKGAMLIGSGPEVLQRVSMVGKDLRLDAGIGVCGKEGQSVPVGVGQPTLRIDGITVGGTQS